MIRYSWPLLPNLISWWLINEVNRFIILFKLGADYNGVFALAIRFPSIIIMVNTVFMLAWQDQVITTNDEPGKQAFDRKVFSLFMNLQLSLVAVLISVSPFIIKYFVGPAFSACWKYMPPLYLGVAFSAFAGFLGTYYLGAKQTKAIFTTTIIGSIVNIIICISLIKNTGLYAPAFGTCIGYMVMYFARVQNSTAILHDRALQIKLFLLLLYVTAVTTVVYVENDIMNGNGFIVKCICQLMFMNQLPP